MNFLSHYYFDKEQQNSYIVLGGALPDLVKNANKDWNLYPQKREEVFTNIEELNVLNGWKRHLKIDSIFHSSSFFFEQTSLLKQQLIPILTDSPVRPSFLAHIGLELLLDHILVRHDLINITTFYKHLEDVDLSLLSSFLTKAGLVDFSRFVKFFEGFKSSKYLWSYQEIDQIGYALERICMRLWSNPFQEKEIKQLAMVLSTYKKELEHNFILIFEEIESRLNN